jgi:hypothetical protein
MEAPISVQNEALVGVQLASQAAVALALVSPTLVNTEDHDEADTAFYGLPSPFSLSRPSSVDSMPSFPCTPELSLDDIPDSEVIHIRLRTPPSTPASRLTATPLDDMYQTPPYLPLWAIPDISPSPSPIYITLANARRVPTPMAFIRLSPASTSVSTAESVSSNSSSNGTMSSASPGTTPPTSPEMDNDKALPLLDEDPLDLPPRSRLSPTKLQQIMLKPLDLGPVDLLCVPQPGASGFEEYALENGEHLSRVEDALLAQVRPLFCHWQHSSSRQVIQDGQPYVDADATDQQRCVPFLASILHC